MPNPSELARLEEEYETALAGAYNFGLGKSSRERYLQEARVLGKRLGYNTKPYNGFSDHEWGGAQ